MRIRNRYLQKILYRPKVLFIHIPKTGGTYVRQYENNRSPLLFPILDLGHAYIVEQRGVKNPVFEPKNIVNERFLKQYTVVSTVRNTYDWLVSYAGHAGGWNPKYKNPDHHDYEAATKGFDYLIKTIANRETPWPSRKFIFCQLFSSSGKFVVDWLCDMSKLDDDLRTLAATNDLTYTPSNKQRMGKREAYQNYYSDSLVDLVSETWAREIGLFGYQFEQLEPVTSRFRHEISPDSKTAVKYIWETDEFFCE